MMQPPPASLARALDLIRCKTPTMLVEAGAEWVSYGHVQNFGFVTWQAAARRGSPARSACITQWAACCQVVYK